MKKMLSLKSSKVKTRSRSSFYNASGCADPTAYHALKPIIQEESEMENEVHTLVHIIRDVVNLAGFEVIGRIQFRHKKTGREFK